MISLSEISVATETHPTPAHEKNYERFESYTSGIPDYRESFLTTNYVKMIHVVAFFSSSP